MFSKDYNDSKMPISSIQVLGISADEQEHSAIKNTRAKSSQLHIHGRVRLYEQSESFDTVRLRFQGAIRIKIGSKVDLEMLPSTSQLLSRKDFKPTYAASQSDIEEESLDFIIPMPTTTSTRSSSAGYLEGFVPSMTLAGSTYVTRVTALKDRHLVEGSCRVVYWLEADLLRSDSSVIVRKLCCPVDFSSLHVPLQVSVANRNKSDHVEQIVRLKTSSWRFNLASQPQPELSVRLPSHLGTISSLVSSGRQISIPVSVNLYLPPGTAAPPSLRCTITSNWYTSRTFALSEMSESKSATYTNPESTIENTTVSKQKLDLVLPPLYHPHPDHRRLSSISTSTSGSEPDLSSRYSTSMNVDILLPDSVSSPSIKTTLLHIRYVLDMSMRFEFDDGNCKSKSSLKPCTAQFSMPVTLSADNPTLAHNMHQATSPASLSPLVERGLVTAPPPYIY